MANLLSYNQMITDINTYVSTEAKAARDGFQRALDAVENIQEAALKERYASEIAELDATGRDDIAYNVASVFGAAADYLTELDKIKDIELNL